MSATPFRLLASTALLTAGLATGLDAQQTVVIPNGMANAAGSTANNFPFGYTGTAWPGLRTMACYDTSHFTQQGINQPILIQSISWRANDTTASWTGGTHPNATIAMASAAVDYTAVTTTFASNVGPDYAVVYTGPVTVTAGAGAGTGTPSPFYITVQIPGAGFLYDPTAGNDLIVDCDNMLGGWSGGSTTSHDVDGSPSAMASRIYASSNYPTANGTTQNHGIVIELGYVPASGLYANFDSDVQTGSSPLTVNFTDTSFTSTPTGVTTWAWDFENDGTIDSTLQNPSHVYPACGSYDVALTVDDGVFPTSTIVKNAFIQPDLVPITPSFSFTPIAANVYQFMDTSTPTPTAWEWDFDNDGIVDSTGQNPAWAFPSPCGAEEIRLAVYNQCHGPWETVQSLAIAPNTFSTTFVPNNGLSGNGAGNLFDIDVTNPRGVNICGLTLTPYSTTAGNPITCEVWVTDAPGGVQGNYNDPSVWRLMTTGSGIDTGTTGALTAFDLNQPLYLPFGQYAMAIGTSQGLRYQTLSAGPTTVVGPDFTITAGRSASTLFTAGIDNRAICGELAYSIAGGGDLAGFGLEGIGCPGSLGQSTITASGPPQIGTTFTVTVDNLPANAAILMTGFSNTTSVLGSLPLSTAPFGAPGCALNISPDVNTFLAGTGNTVSSSLTIPANAVLIDVLMFQQAVVLDPGFNAASAVGSDSSAVYVGL